MMISPHLLNMRLKRVKNMVELHDDIDAAVDELDRLRDAEYDMSYFTKSMVEAFCYNLQMAMIMYIVNDADHAKACLGQVRSLLDRVMVKELLLVNRFFKDNDSSSPDDVGEFLYMLPDAVKYEIHRIVYRSL